MANDEVFPVQGSTGGTTNGRFKGAVQLDLSELESKLGTPSPRPGGEMVGRRRITPAGRKADGRTASRYTIYVPHDEGARINVGAAAPNNSDPGISLDTKTHIHAYAFGSDHASYLSLGSTTLAKAFHVNLRTSGYAFGTVASSNHFAAKDLSIASLDESVSIGANKDVRIDGKIGTTTISGKIAVNATSDGNVQISAGTDVPVNTSFWSVAQAVGLTAVDVADFAAPGIGYFSPGAGAAVGGAVGAANFVGGFATADAKALHDAIIVKSSDTVNKVLTHIESITALILSFKKTRKEGKDRKTGFQSAKAWGTWAIGAGAELYSIYSDIKGSTKSGTGEVKITAKGNATLTANGSVAVAGIKGATLSGFKSASMNGLTVGMKGHKAASVWGGLGASVKSVAGDVSMSSDLKGASIGAKKDIKIASETGKVTVTGDDAVQFNSVSKDASIYGATGAYIGSGARQGFGVVMKPKTLSLGTLANADNFATVAADGVFTGMKFTDKIIEVRSGTDSKLMLRTSAFEVNTKDVNVKASGNVTVKGSKILLG